MANEAAGVMKTGIKPRREIPDVDPCRSSVQQGGGGLLQIPICGLQSLDANCLGTQSQPEWTRVAQHVVNKREGSRDSKRDWPSLPVKLLDLKEPDGFEWIVVVYHDGLLDLLFARPRGGLPHLNHQSG